MNATAKDRECLTEEGLCKHELPSKGWFRDALSFLTSVIFRPHPAGPSNPKPAGKRDTPQVKAREVQAINVLSRAAHDSRRFHAAASGWERKRFLEAINATDNFREFSFVKVCRALGADPDRLRRELLADISLIWLGYSGELGGRHSLLLQHSLARRFARSRAAQAPITSQHPNGSNQGLWPRNQNQTERPDI